MPDNLAAAVTAAEARRIASRPVVPELLEAEIQDGASRLRDRLRNCPYPVTDAGLEDFVTWYAMRLAGFTNLIVAQRYTSFHLALDGLWRPRPAPAGDAQAGAGRAWLDRYVAYEKAERLLYPDGPLPELGRLVAAAQDDWLDAVIEMLERLAAHRAEVARMTGMTPDGLPPLSGAEFGISDPHEGGRCAAILSMGQHRVVYKPRTLACEIAWSQLAAQVVAGALDLPMRECVTVTGDDYGFMEFIGHEPCRDDAAVSRCYLRYGALLALAHAIGTFDLHHENVIVSSEYPVVVDAEPLMRARLRLSSTGETLLASDPDVLAAGIPVRPSVLETAILPGLMRSPFDVHGTGRPAESAIGALSAFAREPVWEPVPCGLGSDDMQIRMLPVVAADHPNLPRTEHGPCLPGDYVEAVVQGFQAAYEYLSGQRAGLGVVSPAALGRLAEGMRVRAILRPTMDYAVVLSHSFSTVPCQSAQRREQIILDNLATLGEVRRDLISDWVDGERQQLMRGDIPRFELTASGAQPPSLIRSPLDDALARVEAMDQLDSALQVVAIREQLRQGRLASLVARTDAEADLSAALPQQIEIIAEAFAAALETSGSLGSWVYAQYVPGLAAIMTHLDPEALYDGSAGTAVALAEAGNVLGRDRWCALAASIFQPLVEGAAPVSRDRTGGLARGLGGLLYAMARVGTATGRDDMLRAACRIAVTWGPELAAGDPQDELLYGRAGLLLGLLALRRRISADELDPVIDTAAGRLIERAFQGANGACWSQDPASALPHASHGTAGIAMALARWGRLRDDAKALDLAAEAIRFDDQSWCQDRSGWRDGRFPSGEEQVTWSWCNGRAGALLSRLSVAEDLGIPFTVGLVEQALAAPDADATLAVSAGLCCGSPGVADALAEICRHQPDAGQDERLSRVTVMLARRTPASQLSTLTSSLFTGTGGLLLGLLRAYASDTVESVLRFG